MIFRMRGYASDILIPESGINGLWGRTLPPLPLLPRRLELEEAGPLTTPLAVPTLSFLRLISPGGTGALAMRILP
jgi:hypothetical protein